MDDATQPDHPTRPDIDLLDGHFYGNDPHPQFTWMRANAPVYFDAANGVWGITRYADLKAIAADPSTFSNAEGIRPDNGPLPMMIDMDDPAHLRRRKLVNKGFTPRRVRESEDRIRVVCDSIIDAVCERGSCDLVHDLAAPLPMIMIGDALGVAPDDRAELLRWSDDMVSGLSGVSSSDEAMMRAATAFSDYETYSGRVIAERRAQTEGERSDDLMSVLVHADVDGDRLDDPELVHGVVAHPDRGGRDHPPRPLGWHAPAARQPRRARPPRRRPVAAADRGRGDAALGQPDPQHGPRRDP